MVRDKHMWAHFAEMLIWKGSPIPWAHFAEMRIWKGPLIPWAHFAEMRIRKGPPIPWAHFAEMRIRKGPPFQRCISAKCTHGSGAVVSSFATLLKKLKIG